jgi:diketogulonate reductase-like aldo/keto reductase
MRERTFGPTGERLPPIGQGTWNLEHADRRDAVRALQRGFELGLTHVDTAEMYGHGAAEEIVGEALRSWRREVFVVTKVLPHNASRRGAVQACERSLRRLGVECIDLYLLHWPGRHPLEHTIAAFEELAQSGKIRFFGVSNFDASQLEDAVRIAGPGAIACNQVLYHLDQRAIEHRVIPSAEERDVAVVAYSPFGSGDFPQPGSSGFGVLDRIASARDATPRQVTLAFLTRSESVFAIPKAIAPDHVEENAGALDIELEPREIQAIDAAFPRGREPDGLPMI